MLAEAEDEGIALAEVARRHDVHPQQLYAWRSMARKASSPPVPVPTFLPVEIAEQPTQERRRRTKAVEVTLRNGRRLRVDPEIAPETLVRLVQTLESA
ncbi:insertion sequence transposase [Stappia sp. 22II-S9-Z10]|nr:insertion sequence transposase [Stappia sp. 22II-S9-Z10]